MGASGATGYYSLRVDQTLERDRWPVFVWGEKAVVIGKRHANPNADEQQGQAL